MRALISKAEIEAEIGSRFGKALTLQEKAEVLTLATGVSTLDAFTGGFPRGAVTEIFGPASSGRTSLLFSIFAYATTHDEVCAIVDTHDTFAPTVAAGAGVNFDNLLWVRCGANLENAFKTTDLLLHAGGFGLVALDLGDVAGKDAKRIISSWWHRFRRTVENKPVTVVVVAAESCVRSCAALSLELKGTGEWESTNDLKPLNEISQYRRKSLRVANAVPRLNTVSVTHGNLLHVNSIAASRHRPITPSPAEIHLKAHAC
jgi:RecA/RadA recombinase